MKDFNILKIKKGDYVFELTNEMEIGFLIHYAYPFTGGSQCSVPSGFKFTITQLARDDAFYISPVDNDKSEVECIYAKMMELSKSYDPKLANRIQGFSFYIMEEQLRTAQLKFHKGSPKTLYEIIEKKKEETEYYKNYNPFADEEWVEKNFGSASKEMEECGKPKVLKVKTDICPFCGHKLRLVFWGEVTPEIQQKKKEGKIFIGEELYGKDSDVDYKQKYGDYSFIMNDTVHPKFACGNCGESFVLKDDTTD